MVLAIRSETLRKGDKLWLHTQTYLPLSSCFVQSLRLLEIISAKNNRPLPG